MTHVRFITVMYLLLTLKGVYGLRQPMNARTVARVIF